MPHKNREKETKSLIIMMKIRYITKVLYLGRLSTVLLMAEIDIDGSIVPNPGQNPTGQNPTGHNPYGQNPTRQNPTGQNPTT